MQHLSAKLDGLSSALPSSNDATLLVKQSRPSHDPVQTKPHGKTPRALVEKEGTNVVDLVVGAPRLEFVADPVF